MIEFNSAESGEQVARQSAQILSECKSAAKGGGLVLKFPEGTPSFVLTFSLRHIANEIDKIATLDPESASDHFKTAARIGQGIGRLLDEVKNVDPDENVDIEYNIESEEDLTEFYLREGLEPPDDDTPEI